MAVAGDRPCCWQLGPALIRAALEAFARRTPPHFIVWDRERVQQYLCRWYLLWRRNELDGNKPKNRLLARMPFNLFMHRFRNSDDAGELHSHPWRWAISLVLIGGYSEERRVGDRVVRIAVKPWSLNFIKGHTYHRVDLENGEAWTLFLVGPRKDTWFFWNRETRMRSQWEDYLAWKNGEKPDANWELDQRERA